ncbi:MAG: hypothetical protein ACQEQS_02275 [Thermodesulfobacteriota bacterium]
MKIVSQIYEIQTPEEALLMAESGVDNIGSVVTDENSFLKDKELKAAVDTVKKNKKTSSVIPLFSDFDKIMELTDYLEPDIVHFCESLVFEDEYKEKKAWEFFYELQHKIKTRNSGLKIMRSIPVISDQAEKKEKEISREKVVLLNNIFYEVSDFFLTDTFFSVKKDEQPVPGFIGITGKTCDRDIAGLLIQSSKIPVILAGGLSPENVYDAVTSLKPYGADSCTNTNAVDENGINIRFRKDKNKVAKFIKELKRAEKDLENLNN